MSLRRIILLSPLMIAVLLSGCSFLSPVKVKPVGTYTISAFREGKYRKASHTNRTLLVALPTASPGYETSKMIYVNVPFKLRSFVDNRWVAPPAILLTQVLANRLRQTGYFHAVVTPPFTGASDYELETQLQMLQQEFLSPESSVHLILRATLINEKNSAVVASRLFDIREAAPGNDPYNGVLATNKAAEKLSTKVAQFVVASITKKR